MSFGVLLIIGVLFGVGFGYFVQRSGLCFAQGLAELYMGRGKRILRLFFGVFIITAAGFLLSGQFFPDAGLKPIGLLRGQGLLNLVSGILFGAGIALCGGCILGTLRQLGAGNLTYLVVLLAFIPGLAFVAHVLNPLLERSYQSQKPLLPDLVGLPAASVTAILAVAALIGFLSLRRRKN